jgi:hypothetical protein
MNNFLAAVSKTWPRVFVLGERGDRHPTIVSFEGLARRCHLTGNDW